MIRVLVVDDDADKMRRILTTLYSVDGCDASRVDEVRNLHAAKRLLRENRYDLLVLDIAVPETSDRTPDRLGGIRLLRELAARSALYCVPQHIVGLTAFDDVIEVAGLELSADLWSVLKYDPTSETWQELLRRKVRHIMLAERNPAAMPEHKVDLCVIVALQTPELDALLRLRWHWESFVLPNDGTEYFRGRYVASGAQRTVVAAAASRMGMPASAVLATKMIEALHPRFIGIAGIAAGLRGKCAIGDILAADPGWDYGSGKYAMNDGIAKFAASPHQVALNSMMRGRLSAFARGQEAMDEIRRSWPGRAPREALKMHIGPVASGAAVLSSASMLQPVQEQNRKLLGIEMETYGLFVAATECSLPQPLAFSLKSVSDFADETKTDDFQEYAAYTSAAALQRFAECYL